MEAVTVGGFGAERFRTALSRACTAAGVAAFSPHDVRHRRVSLLHAQNVPQEFVPGAPATASGMVLGLGSPLAGIGYIVLGRVQETVGLTSGILIGFSMVVPAALIALVVLLRARGETPVHAH